MFFKSTIIALVVAVACVSVDPLVAQTDSRPPSQFTWTPEWLVSRDRPGYPLLEGVEHFAVQLPSVAAGAYHHHPQISVFRGHFFASWSTHRSGEDGPGQYVNFSHSADGLGWSPPAELFPALDKMKVSNDKGRALTALRFVEANGKLFAIAEAHQNTGFIRHDQLMTSSPGADTRSQEFPKRSRKGLGRLVREVSSQAAVGTIFWLNNDKPEPLKGFADYSVATQENLPELGEIKKRLASPVLAPTWDFKNNTTELRAQDGVLLTEPCAYQALDGSLARLWRAQNDSLRMYGQTSRDGNNWSPPTVTPIPDAPAKTVVCNINPSTVALVGNQVFNKRGTRRDPITIAISKNGFDFDRVFSLRWRAPKFRTAPQQADDGRGTGFQYPSVAVENGYLWIIYSVNKEAIDISRISCESLLSFSPCGFFNAKCIADVVEQSEDRFKDVEFDKDAVLNGLTSARLADQSYQLKMVWQLKKGRRSTRFIHICDAQGKVIRQGNLNRALFDSVTEDKTVLDSIRLSAEDLRGASSIAIGFYDSKRKSAPIAMPDGTKRYKLKVIELSP